MAKIVILISFISSSDTMYFSNLYNELKILRKIMKNILELSKWKNNIPQPFSVGKTIHKYQKFIGNP